MNGPSLPPVVGRLIGDSTDYVRSLRDAESQTDKTAKSTSSNFSKMAGALAKVVGTGALLTFAKNARDMSSDVAEAGSKVGVVFGTAQADVDAFAESSAKAFGISKREALSAAGTFGNLFVATGLAQDAASKMSVDVVKLAADLGSFNNLGTDEVLEKLRSGLVGEVEPLRALGINFNAAAVEAKAMELGLAGANGEVSEGAKVQARYALILEQTKTAQGDFSRTSDGMANSSKIAAASAEDQAAKFGDVLAPAMAQANQMATAALELFNNLPAPVQQVTIGVGLLSAAVVLLAGRTAAWTAVTKLAAAAQLAFNLVLAANPIALVVLALAALTAAVVIAYQNSETFRNAVGALGDAFVFMKNVALGAVRELVDNFLAQIEWIVRAGARAFGWVPGIGPKLREAAGWVEGFRNDVNAMLGGIRDKNVNVNMYYNNYYRDYYETVRGMEPWLGSMFAGGRIQAAAIGLMTPGGGRPRGPTLVSEAGYDEWVITPDPRYRRRNLALWAQAGQALGVGSAAGAGRAGTGWGSGNTYVLNVYTATGDIPDETIRKLRRQLFEMENDYSAGSIIPAA